MDPALIHVHHLAEPAHASILQQAVHAGVSCSRQGSGVGNYTLPYHLQDASQAAYLKGFQESNHDAGAVDADLGVL